MKEKYFVICGTHSEYIEFAMRKCNEIDGISMSNFIFINDVMLLKGYQNPHGWFYGTWYKLPNLQDILVQLLTSTHGTTSHFVEINEKAIELRKQCTKG
jgi:hypothetical protein